MRWVFPTSRRRFRRGNKRRARLKAQPPAEQSLIPDVQKKAHELLKDPAVSTQSSIETHKEKASAEGSGDLLNGAGLERQGGRQNGRIRTAILSECQDELGGRGGDDNAHLDMSLKEFPLDLVPVRNIEVGLDRDGGSGILFPGGSSFVLDVHGGRGAGVETVGGRRADELEGSAIGS